MSQNFEKYQVASFGQSSPSPEGNDNAVLQGWQPPEMAPGQTARGDSYQLRRFDTAPSSGAAPAAEPAPAVDAPQSEDEILANELQALREKIREEAYATGLAEGQAEAKRMLAEQTQQLQLTVAALREPAKWLDVTLQRELSELTSALVKALIGHELTVSPERVGLLVKEAIELLPVTQGPIDITLHPDDARVLAELNADADDAETPWRVTEDATLSRGGCRIQSGSSRIDQSIDARLAAILSASESDHA